MLRLFTICLMAIVLVLAISPVPAKAGNIARTTDEIPLPEHPRPDFRRPLWQNLNGAWEFAFDTLDRGVEDGWAASFGATRQDPDGHDTVMTDPFDMTIMVPFPWGSRLSGVDDEADIGWYRREISVDPEWEGRRIFLTIGASDWETTVWLDGKVLGTHRGGYVPFSFELTGHIRYGESQQLVIRADDARRDFTLYGKQGYGNARGIWQTVYLEARGESYLDALHFAPDIDQELVSVTAYLQDAAERGLPIHLKIEGPDSLIQHRDTIPAGEHRIRIRVPVPEPRLWDLDDPYLYEVEASLGQDTVYTYFGMRKISVEELPGSGYPYIALNGEPLYLQLALDQSYHPDGYYTFPSDRFIQEEIQRSKSIGLNGIRTHIKVEVPRKLYWADRLGLLVMEDLPNSWGEPDERMQAESEYTMRQMIRRDYNHPSIFSWVLFNETWGLYSVTGTDERGNSRSAYLPETQDWVASMYYLAKSLDQTRLVEDNSICCGRGHTETDINSWHQYLPGWEWEDFLKNLTENTFEGSGHNFEEGFSQAKQPNINSECGNVWGYDGSTGDVDWSWDYHRMINAFRRYPKVAGWLYTEHHDVINEWNGYWRFDRTEKETGLGEIVEGMTLNDLHSKVYLSNGIEICRTVQGGETVEVPLFLSVMTGEDPGRTLQISYELSTLDAVGLTHMDGTGNILVEYTPWMQQELEPLTLRMPETTGIATLSFRVADPSGKILHRNFMHFEIVENEGTGEGSGSESNTISGNSYTAEDRTIVSIPADQFSGGEWSRMQWNVLEGRKVNGAGSGFFEYTLPVPTGVQADRVREATFLVELSAKEFFVKDQVAYDPDQDFMRGSVVAPSANPNSYPMTDETFFPSEIRIIINGEEVLRTSLPDDPADHRGVLSWHHQLKDRKLREAGSYGYLVKVPVTGEMLEKAISEGALKVRMETLGEGGIAIYGKEFGRYPLDPSLVFRY